MTKLHQTTLNLSRCPHCGVDTPNLEFVAPFEFQDYLNRHRIWGVYVCRRCAGIVIAEASGWNDEISKVFPQCGVDVSNDIPERARPYLIQAMDSIKSPSGAVMLAASAVDAMLKAKNITNGTLNDRINQAAEEHIITSDMAEWAHNVRIDANTQRHADESMPLPDSADASRCIEFALALGQIMFVLPTLVQRGIESAKQ